MDKQTRERFFKAFKNLGVDAIALNHYDLADATGLGTSEDWKAFLIDPEISAYITQEANLLLQVELRKLSKDASDSKSVGQAQLINALGKMSDDVQTKDGPIFIYTYIPLNDKQELAENVLKLSHDIFLKNKEEPTIVGEVEINEDF